MNQSVKTIAWIAAGIIVIGGIWFFANQKSDGAAVTGPVKVGVVLPLSGDAAVYGEPARNIYRMAVEEINAKGGVKGQDIELVIEDGKCNGKDAASAAQKLINVDKVKAIIGGWCSSESLAIVPIARQHHVALLSAGSSSPKLTGIDPIFARNYPSDSAQGTVLADIAYTDKSWKKVAFIQEQTDYAQGVYTAFSDRFKKLGGEVTNEQFPTATTDFRTIVTKVQGQSPDAVFLSTQTPAVAARILTQINQLGWKPKLMVADVVPGDAETVTAQKDMLEGALTAEFGVNQSNSKFKTLSENYQHKFSKAMPYQGYAQTEYDAVYLMRDAVAAVGYDGQKIAQWLHTEVKDWQGATGSVTIGTNGDPKAGHRAEIIVDGKVEAYQK